MKQHLNQFWKIVKCLFPEGVKWEKYHQAELTRWHKRVVMKKAKQIMKVLYNGTWSCQMLRSWHQNEWNLSIREIKLIKIKIRWKSNQAKKEEHFSVKVHHEQRSYARHRYGMLIKRTGQCGWSEDTWQWNMRLDIKVGIEFCGTTRAIWRMLVFIIRAMGKP